MYSGDSFTAFCPYAPTNKNPGGGLLDHHLAELKNLAFWASRLCHIGTQQKTELAVKGIGGGMKADRKCTHGGSPTKKPKWGWVRQDAEFYQSLTIAPANLFSSVRNSLAQIMW